MSLCTCDTSEEVGCMESAIVFRLVDNEYGIDALFSVAEGTPGQVSIDILCDGSWTRPDNVALERILAHPNTSSIRLHLVACATKSWTSWQEHSYGIQPILSGATPGEA